MKRKGLMSGVLSPLCHQLELGGIGSFIVGYATNKISKLIAVLLGLFTILLLYLETSGIISVNYEELLKALAGLPSFAGHAAAWFIGLISLLPFIDSFVARFFLGLKVG